MPGVTEFVQQRSGTLLNQERLAAGSSLRVPVPRTVLNRNSNDKKTTAWETDSEVADTTITSFQHSAEMQEQFGRGSGRSSYHDEYVESEDDHAEEIEELQSMSPAEGLPNELQAMMERPRQRWSMSARNMYADHNRSQYEPPLPSPQAPKLVLPGQREHLAQFLRRPAPQPYSAPQSDGDDDEPLPSQSTRKSVPKSARGGPRATGHNPPQSPDLNLPIQTKNTPKTPTTESPHVKREKASLTETPQDKAPLPVNIDALHDGSLQNKVTTESKSSPNRDRHSSIPKHPGGRHDTFDVTDASAVVDETNDSDHVKHPESHDFNAPFPATIKRQRQPSLDYSLEALRTMNFTDLQSQPFDKDPNSSCTPPPQLTQHPHQDQQQQQQPEQQKPLSLSERLAALTENNNGDSRADFFSTLSPEEWEDCGDWFVDQFSALVKKMKEARRERRRVAEDFEKEIAERYADVDANMVAVQKVLDGLQQGGSGLLAGRTRGI